MKYANALLVGGAAAVSATSCSGAFEELGNWYCPNSVKQVKYGGLDASGKYRAVAQMDSSGTCTFEDKDYSGAMAPFQEGVSLHYRGPLKLLNVAVYHPVKESKRDVPTVHSKRHGHQHLHKKHHEEKEKRVDIVTAVINGITQSWENDWTGGATATATAETAATATATEASTATSSDSSSDSSSDDDDEYVAPGNFKRVAYYNAKDQVADGLVFLGNKGDPSLSGTFDNVWGNSLAYVNEDGTSAAASPTVLKDTLLDDDTEVIIYSDTKCDGDCGTVRPDTVAYKGFEGSDQVFVVEVQMPMSGKTGWNQDMPAFWMLNAAIARTGQYSDCSCWCGDNASPQEGGCGEADILEVLTSGSSKAKSTIHMAGGVGDSHYFDRPADEPVKVAVVFQASTATLSIKVLDDFDFSTSLTADDVESMVEDESDISLFSLMTLGLFD